ncbi:hypothetical protein ACTG2D_20235 [Aeromonas veronii]
MNVDIKNIRTFIGNGFFFSTLLGIYYFVIFTYYENIPFPLDSSALPTIFSSLGILGILLTGVFLFYSSMSVMIIVDPLKIDYHGAFYTKTFGVKNKNFSSIINYIIFFCTPLLFLLALFMNDAFNNYTFIGFAIIPVLFSIHVLSVRNNISYNDNRIGYLTKLGAHVVTFVYLGFFSVMSYTIFYSYITFTVGLDSDINSIMATFVFLVLNYIIILPQRKQNGYEVNAKKYSDRNYIRTFFSTPAAPIYIMGLIFSLSPNIAYKNTSKVFSLINAGGGLERTYYFFKSSSAQAIIPASFIKECKEELCITNPLRVILDINDIIYVRGNLDGNENALISIPKKNMQVLIPLKERAL